PASRCERGTSLAALPRAPQGDLEPAQGRGAQGLQRRCSMSGGCIRLLWLQALVAILVVGILRHGAPQPVRGCFVVSQFFFLTPADVAGRVGKLFADGTGQIVGCADPIDLSRLLSTSDPCFGKTVWQHLSITLTEGILAFVVGAVAGVALGFWFARNA